MDLNDKELSAIYSQAESYMKIIFEGLKAENIDDVLYSLAERILDEVAPEYQNEVIKAINKHIDFRDMLLPMLDIGYEEDDTNLDWEDVQSKLKRLLR